MRASLLVVMVTAGSGFAGPPDSDPELAAKLRAVDQQRKEDEEEKVKTLLEHQRAIRDAGGAEPLCYSDDELCNLDGYQSVVWGAPKKAVRKAFPKNQLSADGFLVVDGKVATLSATTAFVFARDKLKAVAIAFDDVPGKVPEAVFKTLVDALSKKYGVPDMVQLLSDASATWSGAKTKIILNLKAAGPKHVLLSYQSVALLDLEDTLTEDQAKGL